MKKLYIIRHAKSEWKDLMLRDFERPLNKRGKKDAPFMGRVLKKKGVIPDAIYSSPAKRAKSTAKKIAKEIGFQRDIIYDRDIFEASVVTLKSVINSIDDKYDTVFLFGHNPGLNDLVEDLVDIQENLPTSGIVEIDFECKKWSKASSKNARLISFDYPKKHQNS